MNLPTSSGDDGILAFKSASRGSSSHCVCPGIQLMSM